IPNDSELREPARRHALYFTRLLGQIAAAWESGPHAPLRASHMAALGNVRAALEWSFSNRGEIELGVGLAGAAVPVFLGMSLLTECHHWAERALASLTTSNLGGVEEMSLQAGLAMSTIFTRDHGDAAREAFTRSLAIAEQTGELASQIQML